ncbi:hypothetical protein QFC21_002503 [Naganishia friedmannii]|uniref:Uncharacterized protein n=1 Tax=Naganishia friedmannii TaxID=89922 RepID=A0ACC2VWB8_9TREE|nr:hypothetical protein QFC21_002503 [Naganishia friedmannii]
MSRARVPSAEKAEAAFFAPASPDTQNQRSKEGRPSVTPTMTSFLIGTDSDPSSISQNTLSPLIKELKPCINHTNRPPTADALTSAKLWMQVATAHDYALHDFHGVIIKQCKAAGLKDHQRLRLQWCSQWRRQWIRFDNAFNKWKDEAKQFRWALPSPGKRAGIHRDRMQQAPHQEDEFDINFDEGLKLPPPSTYTEGPFRLHPLPAGN